MTALALVLAGIAAALHVYIWTMESLTWKQPATWKRFGLTSQSDADITAPMAFNQGFYNLFLAIATIAGIVCIAGGGDTVGWTLIITACGSMLAAALVLVSTGMKYARAAATQGTIPLLAVIASIVAAT
jgi:putative membrane protein